MHYTEAHNENRVEEQLQCSLFLTMDWESIIMEGHSIASDTTYGFNFKLYLTGSYCCSFQ